MIFKVRAIVFSAAFLILFSGISYAVLLDRVVAVVNKDVITWSELYRAMDFEASSSVKALPAEERRSIYKESEARFLEGMIDMKLQLQAARKLDLDAGMSEVSEAIDNIKNKYSMNNNEFEESLKKEGFSLEEYKRRIAEQIILSKVVAQEVRNRIVLTDREIDEFMAVKRESGYRIRQIFFKSSPDKSAVETKAETLLARIKNGDDFAMLAAQYSEDPSAKSGGDLGFIRREYLVKEFLEVISKLKDGDVSRPFWTARGLHIIKLEESSDVNAANAANKDELRESAKKKLFDKRFNEALKNWNRGLREKAYVEVRL